MDRQLIFINSTGDTFTPTHSGAIATWIWEMCRASQASGWEPWVLTRTANVDAYPWVRTVEIAYPFPPLIRGSGRFYRWLSKINGWAHIRESEWVKKILGIIKKNGWTEAMLVLHNDPELLVALRASLPNAKLIHLFHNCNHVDPFFRERFSDCADVVLAVSTACARLNEHYFGCVINILRNGVDVNRFAPLPDVSKTRPVIGFVGRTDRQKGPDLLLRAALRISEKFNKFDLQLLGARFYGMHAVDSYQKSLENLATRLNQRGVSVYRPGFVNRLALPRQLAKGDIHVVPSRWEDPCPLTVLEGMATGQAVVAAACGGIPEIVGSSGFLFERDDVGGLETKLQMLLQDDFLRRSYGLRARQRAEQRPWEIVFRELEEMLIL